MRNVNLGVFLAQLASAQPTPGGGSVAALTGALAAGLAEMVCHLTIGKPRYAEHEERLKEILTELDGLRAHLLELADSDAGAYEELSAAYKLPRETHEDKAAREKVIQEALVAATEVPLQVAQAAARVIDLVPEVVEKGTRLAVSDAGMAALLGAAALRSAALNVHINLAATTDPHRVARYRQELDAALGDRVAAADELYAEVMRRIGGA